MSPFRNLLLLAAIAAYSAACLPAFGQDHSGVRMRTNPLSFEQFAARQRQLEQDLANQRVILQNSRARLTRWNAGDRQAFQNAFGTTDTATRVQVLMNIENQLALNARMTASNFQETSVIEPDRVAQVDSNDSSTIYLDDEYFARPATGTGSRAGTLVHEMSHFNSVAGTRDYAYGTADAAALAQNYANGTTGDQPAHNADNIRYFVEGAFDAPVPSPAPAPAPQTPPASAPQDLQQNEGPTGSRQSQAGMTQEQFRAELSRQMQEFQAADAQQRRELAQRQIPPAAQVNQTPPIGDVPPAGVRPRVTYDEYAPRNGYDAQGNRTDSNRRRYDENGNYAAPPRAPFSTAIGNSSPADFWQTPAPAPQAPQRQNRVYDAYNNTSRPIGSGRSSAAQQYAAMQQWSNNQIAAMNAQRSAPTYSPSATGGSSASSNSAGSYNPQTTGFGYDETARRGSQIVYDDNAPRQSNRLINDENATNRASTSGNSALDEPAQRPISSPVYDHRPGQSGLVDPGTSSTAPDIAPRQSGQSAPTAAVRW